MLFGLPIGALELVSSRDKTKSKALKYRGSKEYYYYFARARKKDT
jgi:hypothetical protein